MTEGPFSLGREQVEIDMGERHLKALDTIVDPLLVPDLATVVWAPHGHAEAVDSLRRLMQVVLVDSQDEPDVRAALERAVELCDSAYVVDLAWLRSTPWRERVAAAFNPPPLRRGLGEISRSPCATAPTRSPPRCCSAAGCARAWAGARARSPRAAASAARRTPAAAAARSRCASTRSSSRARPGSRASRSRWPRARSVSLDRGPGGLKSVRRARDGTEQEWTVLGASRGESGILGEGVRQALLRDPTYKPALSAARAMRLR